MLPRLYAVFIGNNAFYFFEKRAFLRKRALGLRQGLEGPVPERTERERGNEAEGGIPQSPTGLSQKSVTFSTAPEFKIKSIYCTDLILNVAC